MYRKLGPSILLLFSALMPCWAQTAKSSAIEGGITGTVLTEDGLLASGTKACTSSHSGNYTSINCFVSVDKDGRFTIEHLKLGTYQVFAINDAEGYSIENQSPGQSVTLSADQPWANVTVRLLPRGGILVGSITDKLTGENIQHAQIQFTAIDRDGEGGFSLVDGEFHLAIPANSDVLVIAMAKGYKGWIYADGTSPSRPVLSVAAGERKVLNIQLEPLPDNSARP
jgi:hypothetical protein